ncbi:MAG: hypothetical protein IPH59_01405 [bacterium]|nr:hypothetical protein [bacterium]
MWERSLGGGASGYIIMEMEVAQDSIDASTLAYIKREIGKLPDKSIVEDYNNKNATNCKMAADKFDSTLDVRLIPKGELDAIFDLDGWNTFYEKFPEADGLVWLSPVGFDKSEEFAVLLYQRQFGGLGDPGPTT